VIFIIGSDWIARDIDLYMHSSSATDLPEIQGAAGI
jgi:hypothetical protein